MALAVGQFMGAQLPPGLFGYEYNFLTGVETDKPNVTSPNLVRQAGTASALAEYYSSRPSAGLRDSLRSILKEFGRLSLPIDRGGFQDVIQKLRVLSLPYGRGTLQRTLNRFDLIYTRGGGGKLVSPDGAYESAWLGGTALALITELRYSRASGDMRFAKLRKAWLRGILSLRIPGGGFRAAPHHISEMAYSNGETWLALAVYLKTHPNDRTAAEALDSVDGYFLQRYSEPWSRMFYSWGTMAAETRYATTRDEKFLLFIASQARSFLRNLKAAPDGKSRINCANLEGLVSARRALGAHVARFPELVSRLQALIDLEMPNNRKRQIRPGQERIDLGGGAYLQSPRLSGYAGAFFAGRDNPVTRIDLTQHCLSAIMRLDSIRDN